jgi:hypothetical protein
MVGAILDAVATHTSLDGHNISITKMVIGTISHYPAAGVQHSVKNQASLNYQLAMGNRMSGSAIPVDTILAALSKTRALQCRNLNRQSLSKLHIHITSQVYKFFFGKSLEENAQLWHLSICTNLAPGMHGKLRHQDQPIRVPCCHIT